MTRLEEIAARHNSAFALDEWEHFEKEARADIPHLLDLVRRLVEAGESLAVRAQVNQPVDSSIRLYSQQLLAVIAEAKA